MVVLRYKRVIGASLVDWGHRPAHESRPPSGPRADVNPGSVRWPRLAGHHLLMRCALHDGSLSGAEGVAQSITGRAVAKRLRTSVPSVAVHRPVTSPAAGVYAPSAAGRSSRAKEMSSSIPGVAAARVTWTVASGVSLLLWACAPARPSISAASCSSRTGSRVPS